MAWASSAVSVLREPQPPRAPPVLKLPGKTERTFCPRLATCASTCTFAPLPMLMAAMTAMTPMMMPSMVSSVRSLFRRKARTAIRKVARILMLI